MPSKKKPTSQKTAQFRDIYEDTSIVTFAVAESVIAEADRLLNTNLPSDLMEWLSGYAEAIYANNPKFRKAINSNADHGNAGRDTLYSFMRHWLSSEILKRSRHDENYPQIRNLLMNSGFSMGHELPRIPSKR